MWQICPHSLLAAALPSPPRERAFPAVLEGTACNTDLLLPAEGSPVLEGLVLRWCCGTCLPVTVRASVSPRALSRCPSLLRDALRYSHPGDALVEGPDAFLSSFICHLAHSCLSLLAGGLCRGVGRQLTSLSSSCRRPGPGWGQMGLHACRHWQGNA